jgi:tyrosyl-tRNA synthetase
VKAGGLRVNDVVVTDERATLSQSDLVEGVVKLSLGKKKHVLAKIGPVTPR